MCLLNKCPAGEFSLQGVQVTVLEELDLSENEFTYIDLRLFDPLSHRSFDPSMAEGIVCGSHRRSW
jgi:hypothetical protein